ncbi:MAG: magnesium transporter [Eubacterium sp.]|nr:magnesium transporter [Eubacterium sp.]
MSEKDLEITVDNENKVPDRPDYEAELAVIIRSGASAEEIREKLDDYHDNDIASLLENLTPEERKKLFSILGLDGVSDIFAYLDEEDAGAYIQELTNEQAASILGSMDADDAADILDDLEDEKSEELRNLIDEEAKRDIDLIMSYDEDEIGSRMTTNFVVIQRGLTIRQAMKSLVEQAADNDNISTLYVVEDGDIFYGVIELTELIIAREYTHLEDLISTSYPYVYAHETIDECLEELKDYSEDSIPVLDNHKKLIGVITSQDIVEVVDEEMGEDYARLAGLTSEEDLKEPLTASLKKRIPWLIILFILGMIVSSVAGMFEQVVAQLTMIVCFQSLILGMAGNVGTQSLAVTVRVLMDENLEPRQKIGLIFKELKIGFCNGLLLGMIAFGAIGIYICKLKGYPLEFSFATSGCIGIALLAAMVISSFTGTIVPLFFHKIHVDPAVASGPLISTVNDLVAVITYYGLAWILLINVLNFVG